MKTYKLIFFILIVLTALALVLFAALADIDTADAQEAQPDCWHGCPPNPWLRPFKLFIANVSQCLGPFCGQEHSGPPDGEPVR